jgi:hypothetical protein
MSGNSHLKNGLTLESLSKEEREKAMAIGVAVGTGSVDGAATESRSYLRWEDPVLGINGEGRVTPIMPGCQVTTTVFGREGNLLVLNKQWIGPDGIRGMDMAPAQPHTAARTARTCPSCHANPKTLGYGIEDGKFQKNDANIVIDLKDPDGRVIPKKLEPGRHTGWQTNPYRGLPLDALRTITERNERQDGTNGDLFRMPPTHG